MALVSANQNFIASGSGVFTTAPPHWQRSNDTASSRRPHRRQVNQGKEFTVSRANDPWRDPTCEPDASNGVLPAACG